MLGIEKTKELIAQATDTDVKPNPSFHNFKELFSNLVHSKNVLTMYPIVSVALTYNSKLAVTVTKKDDSEYWVK